MRVLDDGSDIDVHKWPDNGASYFTVRKAGLPPGEWLYDHPFYLLLDMAVGGWPGPPTQSTFPASLLVDYVRVYTKSS